MIIRIFRPTIYSGQREQSVVSPPLPLVSQQSGLLAHVGKPRDPSSTEYLYVTVWENVESTPDEEHLLKDTWIGHYDAIRTD